MPTRVAAPLCNLEQAQFGEHVSVHAKRCWSTTLVRLVHTAPAERDPHRTYPVCWCAGPRTSPRGPQGSRFGPPDLARLSGRAQQYQRGITQCSPARNWPSRLSDLVTTEAAWPISNRVILGLYQSQTELPSLSRGSLKVNIDCTGGEWSGQRPARTGWWRH